MYINWEEAPEGTTHHLKPVDGGASWWIKVSNFGYSFTVVPIKFLWVNNHKNFFAVCDNHHWVITEKPRNQQEERKMFTAKELRDTYPHKQMRMHIEATVPNVHERPAALGQLVKKFMANCAKVGVIHIPVDVDRSFVWDNTPEGHDFWSKVNRHFPRVAPKAAPLPMLDGRIAPVMKVPVAEEVAKPAPKAQVGWW